MLLITGAGGNVGGALAHELAGSELDVRLAFRSPAKASRAAQGGHDAVAMDYHDPASLPPALKGVDTVFLLGTGVLGQAEGERNVVAAARDAGVSRLVKLSVLGAAGEGYALARLHREVERAVEASGLAWTFLRPHDYFQNQLALGGGDVLRAAGDGARFGAVDVRDVARVAARVLTEPGHDGRAYDLTGPQRLGYAEMAAALSAVLGRPVRYEPVSDADLRAGLLAEGTPEPVADVLVDLAQAFRRGDADVLSPAVRELTGRDPVTFEQFARDHADAFRGSPAERR